MEDPHSHQPVLHAGAPLETARAVMLMLHGRGASAEDILYLAEELDRPGWAYLAPQAFGYTWYPERFLAPIERNEPYLSSALRRIGGVLAQVQEAGHSQTSIFLLGFSQGACLALEYVARHPQRYGGVAGLSGGLIGPTLDPAAYPGSLDGTPVFLGCSAADAHIPKERVEASGALLGGMGARVTVRLYPGMGHTVNRDEIAFVQGLMDQV